MTDSIFEEKMKIDLKMVDREAGQFLVLAGLVRSAGLASQHQKLPSLSIYHFQVNFDFFFKNGVHICWHTSTSV